MYLEHAFQLLTFQHCEGSHIAVYPPSWVQKTFREHIHTYMDASHLKLRLNSNVYYSWSLNLL